MHTFYSVLPDIHANARVTHRFGVLVNKCIHKDYSHPVCIGQTIFIFIQK